MPDTLGPDLTLEAGTGGSQRLGWNFLVDMHRLGMLSQIVQPREASIAMALKRSLTSMFPDMAGQMLTSSEAEITWWEPSAKEALSLLLSRR